MPKYFQVLLSVISKTGGTNEDINSKFYKVFAVLKPVWKSNAVSENTKVRMFTTNAKICHFLLV